MWRRSIDRQTRRSWTRSRNSIERVKEGKQLGPTWPIAHAFFPVRCWNDFVADRERPVWDQELVAHRNVTEGDLTGRSRRRAMAEPLMLFFIAGSSERSSLAWCSRSLPLQDYIK